VSYFFFEDFLAAFLAGFFAAFFFAAMISYLLLLKIWTRLGFIGLAGSMWCCDVDRIAPTRTSSVTPRVSPRNLIDEKSETLADDENGPLSRVGSVASVVASTSSIAIQLVVILDEPLARQCLAQIFFSSGCGNF
jgi:hypothetical protein